MTVALLTVTYWFTKLGIAWFGSGSSGCTPTAMSPSNMTRSRSNSASSAVMLVCVAGVRISGTGAAQPAAAEVCLETSLRGPALAEDWAAWAQAWIRLDADLAAQPPATLTLCGERRAARLDLAPQGVLARWLGRWSAPAPLTLLEQL